MLLLYPQAGRYSDGSELLGWAGWDHLAQMQALTTVYLDRKTHGAWPTRRLRPLLAGLMVIDQMRDGLVVSKF
ncbi:DUF7008 domain-containing protein [Micromonospora zamorensis]|uniref:DUF7008 domain-containing protein n=1 Tax=Micromonospora zamorensis TaxID=709883 RepID=UPI00399B7B03